MPGMRRAPAPLSDDWMAEQQIRAEIEAEAWRRLREEIARPPAPLSLPAPASPTDIDPHRGGSLTLKALVRFLLAAGGAYVAYLAGADSRLGEFELWLAAGAGFCVTLALTAFGPLRRAVHFMAETARWALILGVGFGGLWWLLQGQA